MPARVTEMERPVMAGKATGAMDEVIRLAKAGDHLWIKVPGSDGYETLNRDTYDRLFGKPGSSSSSKWMEFFPSIVANARTVDNLVNGSDGRSESLILMHEELQMLTPLVQSREFSFLRYCRQIDQRDVDLDVPSRSRRLPSGCLIADMPDGYSKIEDTAPVDALYRDIVNSGAGFGAQRWLGALTNACNRYAALADLAVMNADMVGVTADGRRGMMRLSQRMVANFCSSMTASQHIQWSTIPGAGGNDMTVRFSQLLLADELGLPHAIVLSATTAIWLPIAAEDVFVFLSDANTRNQGRSRWDVLTNGDAVLEVCRIPSGPDPGNRVTLQRVLQESCVDPSGSMVVFAPMDMRAVNLVMSSEDPANIQLLPTGRYQWGGGASHGQGEAKGGAGGSVIGNGGEGSDGRGAHMQSVKWSRKFNRTM
ncbi:hypothetical protein BRADI_1g46252v3 [Brachypodium distachyon]|uniref:START domain-containing protein n=1 Tax=Brachypodium distachyon TaxID=15368 RepID=A0A2K2DPM3_BRADI|nr:hypothetical protein BRADI_1g46252v3 [Brachypodium distachyon]